MHCKDVFFESALNKKAHQIKPTYLEDGSLSFKTFRSSIEWNGAGANLDNGSQKIAIRPKQEKQWHDFGELAFILISDKIRMPLGMIDKKRLGLQQLRLPFKMKR